MSDSNPADTSSDADANPQGQGRPNQPPDRDDRAAAIEAADTDSPPEERAEQAMNHLRDNFGEVPDDFDSTPNTNPQGQGQGQGQQQEQPSLAEQFQQDPSQVQGQGQAQGQGQTRNQPQAQTQPQGQPQGQSPSPPQGQGQEQYQGQGQPQQADPTEQQPDLMELSREEFAEQHPNMGESGRQRRAQETLSNEQMWRQVLGGAESQTLTRHLPTESKEYDLTIEIRAPKKREVSEFRSEIPADALTVPDEYRDIVARLDREGSGKSPEEAAQDGDLSDEELEVVRSFNEEAANAIDRHGYGPAEDLAVAVTSSPKVPPHIVEETIRSNAFHRNVVLQIAFSALSLQNDGAEVTKFRADS